MTSDSSDKLNVEEILKVFRAMMGRLQVNADAIPDRLVRKARLVQLEVFLAHSKELNDPDKLTDFCVSALTKMKCSIDGDLVSQRGPLIYLGPDELRNGDGVDLKSIMFAGLHK
jgi:hypothetical protein